MTWYRIQLSVKSDNTDSIEVRVLPGNGTITGSSQTYLGTVGSGVNIWSIALGKTSTIYVDKNLLIAPKDFTNAAWTKTVNIEQNNVVAPSNETSTNKLVETASNIEHKISQIITKNLVKENYNLIVYAQADERTELFVVLNGDSFANRVEARIDLVNGQQISITTLGNFVFNNLNITEITVTEAEESASASDIDYRKFLTNRYTTNPVWTDLANSVSKVLNQHVNNPRELLRKIRDAKGLERPLIIAGSKDLGFDYLSDTLTDADYERLYTFIAKFYSQGGTEQFINFIGFVQNVYLEMQRLWTQDYIEFTPSPGGTTILDGGDWYPTSHVNINYDLEDFPNPNVTEIIELFYKLAPIHLVLHKLAGISELPPALLNISIVTQQTQTFSGGLHFYHNDGIAPILFGATGHDIHIYSGAYQLLGDNIYLPSYHGNDNLIQLGENEVLGMNNEATTTEVDSITEDENMPD